MKDVFINKVYTDFDNSLELIESLVSNTFSLAQDRVASDLDIAFSSMFFNRQISLSTESKEVLAVNQQTRKDIETSYREIYIDGVPQTGNFESVDYMGDVFQLKITIFSIIPEGLLRISTNIHSDGKRAVNTFIPLSSQVYETIMEGETFYGRAYVVDSWYLTAYKPFYDDSNNLAGVLFTGLKEEPFVENIKKEVAKYQVGETGHAFIYSGSGNIIYSDGDEGSERLNSILNSRGEYIYRDIIENSKKLGGETYSIEYEHNHNSRNTTSILTTVYYEKK